MARKPAAKAAKSASLPNAPQFSKDDELKAFRDMKAWALALQRVPKANATWAGDSILYHKASDVAVAVAVPGGLFTPVVKSAESKTLKQISEEVKDLATRARNKKLAPHEYQGGSSSVSNLGM